MYSFSQTRITDALKHQDFSLCVSNLIKKETSPLEVTLYLENEEALLTSLNKHDLSLFLIFIHAKITNLEETFNYETDHLFQLNQLLTSIITELGERIIIDLLKGDN